VHVLAPRFFTRIDGTYTIVVGRPFALAQQLLTPKLLPF
jgi:hypothetical protein